MQNKINSGVPQFDNDWGFSPSQWRGMLLSGLIPAILSLIANVSVIIIHLTLCWFRPHAVNRLSLRMIVVACIFNSIFCISQLFIEDISSRSSSCRVFAYVLMSSDAMSCMCLAMVGLNLVTIFVFKWSRPIILEAVYYVVIASTGIIITVVPLAFHLANTPFDNNSEAPSETCWYHYYFDGRINNIFRWMWYYGWLMFALLFAAICSTISILFIVKRHKNFVGTMNVFSQTKKDFRTMEMFKKHSNNNTDIFRKIAYRCVCYPLVPFISKSWGVGIGIAAAVKQPTPYTIYVIDQIFSCLYGVFVGIIYFTDPAINASFSEMAEVMKTRYVYEYFDVEYKPASVEDANTNFSHLKSVEIAPLHRNNAHVSQIPKQTAEETNTLKTPERSASSTHYSVNASKYHFQSRNRSMPTMKIFSGDSEENSAGKCSVVRATSMDVNSFPPAEYTPRKIEQPYCNKKNKVTMIPMRRISSTSTSAVDVHLENAHNTPKLVPFRFPMFAKLMHWILVRLFKVKPVTVPDIEHEETSAFSKVAGNASGSGIKRNQIDAFKENIHKSSQSSEELNSSHNEKSNADSTSSLSQHISDIDSIPGSSMRSIRRKASSINIASLQRSRLKSEFHSFEDSASAGSAMSNQTTGNPSALRRMLGRRLSVKWRKFPRVRNLTITELATKKQIETMELAQPTSYSPSVSNSQNNSQNTGIHMNEKPHSDIESEDLGLPVYPKELHPRPLSQYTSHPIIQKPIQKRELIDETIYAEQKKRRESSRPVSSINTDQSLNLNELFYGTTLVQSNMENIDNLVDYDSESSTPISRSTIELPPSTYMYDDSAGLLLYGSTTIHNIANWKVHGDDERIAEITESWDIFKELKKPSLKQYLKNQK